MTGSTNACSCRYPCDPRCRHCVGRCDDRPAGGSRRALRYWAVRLWLAGLLFWVGAALRRSGRRRPEVADNPRASRLRVWSFRLGGAAAVSGLAWFGVVAALSVRHPGAVAAGMTAILIVWVLLTAVAVVASALLLERGRHR